MNKTHDPQLKSWLESANQPEADFPIQNLPCGIFRDDAGPRVGVAIGDSILDLSACADSGLLDGLDEALIAACSATTLNPLMALPRARRAELRARASDLLRHGATQIAGDSAVTARTLRPMQDTEMLLPAEIGDYTDFYASIHHATNVGRMMRPDNPLLPNYKYIPIGYHGRASSIVPSGTPIRRPAGQTKDDRQEQPQFGPTRHLDYELEVGFFVGPGNALGKPISITDAEEHLVGVCLVNDWSARDIQKWEYQPLGPFLAKSFATTISPWVIMMEALTPFRVPAFERPAGDPAPLEYLLTDTDRAYGGIDLSLEVWLRTASMRERGIGAVRLSQSSFRDMYWTAAQLVAHHSSNGCNLRPGDLLASGTVSGPVRESRGCLLELASRGAEPVSLPNGETRRFLENGDEVILRGYCQRDGLVRIGLGECRGTVVER